MEMAGFIVELAILAAVIAEGWISWKHYRYTLTKKERASAKRKATVLTRWLWR